MPRPDFVARSRGLVQSDYIVPASPDASITITAVRYSDDPRPDLVDDHLLWNQLLGKIFALDGDMPRGLLAALDGMRCLGARLELKDGIARLSRGEIEAQEYDDLRTRYLVPHRVKLTELLKELATWARRC